MFVLLLLSDQSGIALHAVRGKLCPWCVFNTRAEHFSHFSSRDFIHFCCVALRLLFRRFVTVCVCVCCGRFCSHFLSFLICCTFTAAVHPVISATDTRLSLPVSASLWPNHFPVSVSLIVRLPHSFFFFSLCVFCVSPSLPHLLVSLSLHVLRLADLLTFPPLFLDPSPQHTCEPSASFQPALGFSRSSSCYNFISK